MDINKYQRQAKSTAVYPNIGSNLIYTALGLAGEAGEIANKVKKMMRDYGFKPGQSVEEYIIKNEDDPFALEIITSLQQEIGDVLWYTAMTAYEIGALLGGIAGINLDELALRKERNKIRGSGDDR